MQINTQKGRVLLLLLNYKMSSNSKNSKEKEKI